MDLAGDLVLEVLSFLQSIACVFLPANRLRLEMWLDKL
ncbi:MAG: hypothetical protein A4E45_00747 [Methanosaeta sp. PtaB.Bin039]|nr:MAG: hypothetical protein A4E45_00747 [Methanosaeta sp. PtaB.Bin039]